MAAPRITPDRFSILCAPATRNERMEARFADRKNPRSHLAAPRCQYMKSPIHHSNQNLIYKARSNDNNAGERRERSRCAEAGHTRAQGRRRMDLTRSLGLRVDGSNVPSDAHERAQLVRYINVRLAALGASPAPAPADGEEGGFIDVGHDLLAHFREYSRLLEGYLCPVDQRIQTFLDEHLRGEKLSGPVRLPGRTLIADRHGLARELSLPLGKNYFRSEHLESYR